MIHIEVFTLDMQEQVVLFFETCFSALGLGFSPEGRHRDIADIESYYMQGGCFWCLFDNDHLVGTVAIRGPELGPGICELKRFFVEPESQGKGYGNLLLQYVIDFAKSQKYGSIYLDTRNEFVVARHLYTKYGFVQIERYNANVNAEQFFELKLR